MSTASMKGRVCVLTGATSGIGRTTALGLARLGADLVLLGRDEARGRAVCDEARAAGAPRADLHLADLSSQADLRRAAAAILEREPRLHVLLNNAGCMFTERRVTGDGVEMTLALNHVAYFLLTRLLLDRLKASAPARIVNVASRAHRSARSFPFDDLRAERGFAGMRRYGESKLANILFTEELARRLAGTGVTANSLHPGFVRSGFGHNDGRVWSAMVHIGQLFALSPEDGAKTSIWLASSPEVENVTGRYFARCREARTTRAARDEKAQRRLWQVTEELCGLA